MLRQDATAPQTPPTGSEEEWDGSLPVSRSGRQSPRSAGLRPEDPWCLRLGASRDQVRISGEGVMGGDGGRRGLLRDEDVNDGKRGYKGAERGVMKYTRGDHTNQVPRVLALYE